VVILITNCYIRVYFALHTHSAVNVSDVMFLMVLSVDGVQEQVSRDSDGVAETASGRQESMTFGF